MRKEHDSERKRNGRLLTTAGGIFTLALCILGGLTHQQRQAVQSAAAKPEPRPRMVPESADEKAQFIEHAKMLREKWRPWALAHQEQLKRMLNASPNDQAAMLAVWEAVPSNSHTVGLPGRVLMPSGSPLVGVGFGWRALDKNLRTEPPPSRAEDAMMMRRFTGMLEKKLRREFQARRDIVISNGGRYVNTQLWASGRITQRESRTPAQFAQASLEAQRERREVTLDDYYTPTREVVPPYDFLTR